MPFIGTPTIVRIGRCTVKITGLSLDKDATGTVGLAGGPGNISLPADFPTDISGSGLTLVDLIQVEINFVSSPRLFIANKATPPFLVSITPVGGATGQMIMLVRYLWGTMR